MTNGERLVAFRRLNTGQKRKPIFHMTNRDYAFEINNLLLGVFTA